jgi:16S rRNA (adenine1518-N6/adenine1519-N6)-dimethyltransferase
MSRNHFAKKSFGQNFLQDTEIRDQILSSVGDLKGKNILEIGPGLGFLTTKILASKANLTAIELDSRSVKTLNRDFGHKNNFHLIQGDILEENLDTLFEQKKYSIIANIPYNITAPILRKILEKTQNKPEYAIFMIQKEVAHKLCNTKKSILSISVEVFAEYQILFEVSRTCFFPVPRVDSAVIRLDIRKKPLVPEKLLKDFFTVVRAGFHEKRKKLGNHIGKFFGVGANILLGKIDPNLRAEELHIQDWITITENFQKNINPLTRKKKS